MKAALVSTGQLLAQTGNHAWMEDELLSQALLQRGCATDRVDWQQQTPWQNYDAVVIRSTWNYHEYYHDFLRWIETVSTSTVLINSANLLIWNSDKHYLNDLHRDGIPTIPTVFCKKGSTPALQSCFDSDALVIKPVVSASSMDTHKVDKSADSEHLLTTLTRKQDMMIQPFMTGVLKDGELSMVFFDGVYSHAVRKVNQTGDFRVQQEFGGRLVREDPSAAHLALAQQVINSCLETPVYARVDVVQDNEGKPCVSEVELVEPELWMQQHPLAAGFFAEAICSRIQERQA